APATLLPEDLAQVAAEAGDAEMVVWFSEGHVLFALRVATLELRQTPVEPDDPQQAARALALKVRALLTAREEAWTAPSPSRTARVWPLGAGVQFRLDRPQWRISGGPRLSLQIVDAEARARNGQVGSAQRYSAGLGLIGEAAWKFSRHVAALLSISAEALVP